MSWEQRLDISELIGKTMFSVVNKDDAEIIFETTEGEIYKLLHVQDCCENVYVEDIVGDLNDLVGIPITWAEESSNSEDTPPDSVGESYTWTYYKLATAHGYVDIRWCGSSNGYYSERVDFIKT